MLTQGGNVFDAIPEWWNVNGDHVESVIEIRSEQALRNLLSQVGIG